MLKRSATSAANSCVCAASVKSRWRVTPSPPPFGSLPPSSRQPPGQYRQPPPRHPRGRTAGPIPARSRSQPGDDAGYSRSRTFAHLLGPPRTAAWRATADAQRVPDGTEKNCHLRCLPSFAGSAREATPSTGEAGSAKEVRLLPAGLGRGRCCDFLPLPRDRPRYVRNPHIASQWLWRDHTSWSDSVSAHPLSSPVTMR